MTNNIFIACCIVAAELFAAANAQGGCHQLFHHKAVVVQQVVVPQVYYFAGAATHDEALLRKAIRAELQGVLQQLQHAPPNQALVNPPIATASVLSARCARCHSGESAKAGVRLDGFIDDATFRRSIEIISGINVPKAMQGVIGGLQQGDHASIMEEMLKRQPAKQPPAPPMPADPFDAPGIPGVLR